jgi:hypothetical protein
MNLYERYGLSTPIETYLEDLERSRQPGQSPHSEEMVAWSVPLARSRVAECYYLMGDRKNATKHGRYVPKESLEYFYGSWRSRVKTDLGTYDPDWWHGRTNWMKHFSFGVCWASCLEDWKSVVRLAEYPTADCVVDPGMTKEDKTAYVLLAELLGGEDAAVSQLLITVIDQSKKQKPKLLAQVIRALQEKGHAKFQEALEAYLRYFRKSEFKRTSLDKLLCFDGTTLLNAGKRSGLEFKVPPDLEDYIIRLN